jgi:hypothetical protein
VEQVERFEHNGRMVTIYREEDTEFADPRDYDNLGIMFAEGHRHYLLGDRGQLHVEEYATVQRLWAECLQRGLTVAVFHRALRVLLGTTAILPLWLYDHSGLSMQTSPYAMDAAQWDSGIVGWIFDTKKTRELTGVNPEDVEQALLHEVEAYNAYLQGEVYGWRVTEEQTCDFGYIHSKVVDDCWGYLIVSEKDMEYLRDEAKAACDV